MIFMSVRSKNQKIITLWSVWYQTWLCERFSFGFRSGFLELLKSPQTPFDSVAKTMFRREFCQVKEMALKEKLSNIEVQVLYQNY